VLIRNIHEEAPIANIGKFPNLLLSTHFFMIHSTFPITFPKVQHSPKLEIIDTAMFCSSAWRTNILSSGKPVQWGQFGDLSQKSYAWIVQPWAIKRTAFGLLGIWYMTSVPLVWYKEGLNLTEKVGRPWGNLCGFSRVLISDCDGFCLIRRKDTKRINPNNKKAIVLLLNNEWKGLWVVLSNPIHIVEVTGCRDVIRFEPSCENLAAK
jgi:hypothetical protein